MADQDPYEQGAVWIRTDNGKRTRILAVVEDEKGIVPMRRPSTYVLTTSTLAGDSMPQTWTLDGFLNWHERPEGGQPRPKAFIPQQQDTDNRRTP
jgi:hypothetical protein